MILFGVFPTAFAASELIEPPVALSFDLKDLEQRSEKSEDINSEWSQYQAQMNEALVKTVSLMTAESEVDTAIARGCELEVAALQLEVPYRELLMK